MAVLKCKMCGGNLEFTEGQSYGTCDSCGCTMTLPKANDERILNLFNRANHYRRQNEFDKALATYENILDEYPDNAEAYWGCVLSRYGIEYVEDSTTHERIPTCHRLQNESILADLDYLKAIQNASDSHSRKLYEAEAEKISGIQKNILNIARNEKPYDIFICYKETDAAGQRTIDSALAQDIYYRLTNDGYNVFFSRITLEDKLGREYEPYIFAALNSAKIMLVVGTKPEHFNAVWVRNEWARFLALAKKDRNKLLIPCYREMDAYELPEELSLLQSQDMSKIGFMQDLSRGIYKVISESKNAEQPTENKPSDFNLENTLAMAKTSLEAGNWTDAMGVINVVLNKDVTSSEAWFIKMKATEKQIHSENYKELRLKEIKVYGENAIKYASDSDKSSLQNSLKSVYENALMGYIKKLNDVIDSTKIYFDKGWGNIQYTELRENIAKVRNVYTALSDITEDIYKTEKTFELIKQIYNILDERLEMSTTRINQWCPEYLIEQENENKIMSESFNAIELNINKIWPEFIQSSLNKLEKENMNLKKSFDFKSLEKYQGLLAVNLFITMFVAFLTIIHFTLIGQRFLDIIPIEIIVIPFTLYFTVSYHKKLKESKKIASVILKNYKRIHKDSLSDYDITTIDLLSQNPDCSFASVSFQRKYKVSHIEANEQIIKIMRMVAD